jgi:hypothetical protein
MVVKMMMAMMMMISRFAEKHNYCSVAFKAK